MSDKEQLQQAIHDLELAIKNAYPLAGLSVAYDDIEYRLRKAEKIIKSQGELILQLQGYLDKQTSKEPDLDLHYDIIKWDKKTGKNVLAIPLNILDKLDWNNNERVVIETADDGNQIGILITKKS